MANRSSPNSFPNWCIFVKVELGIPGFNREAPVKGGQLRPTLRDDAIHVNDRPEPKASFRRWGALSDGSRFEIAIAVDLLPASARRWL